MPIDVETPESIGWWMNTLWQRLKAEQPRYDMLEAYRRGNPPLPANLPKSLKAATRELIQMSEYNVADLIVQAMVERMEVRAIRTAAAGDENGDARALQIWQNANMPLILTDVFRAMAGMSIGYIAAAVDAEGNPVATYEDPRQMITVQDPVNPVITRAAFKLFHDDLEKRDYAILWLPGQKWVASRSADARVARRGPDGTKRVAVSFQPSQFDLHPVEGTPEAEGFKGLLSEAYTLEEVFVTPIPNRDGVGEFELHIKHLNQINHLILQGIVTATFQAFKQRALQKKEGLDELPDEDPETGEKIDYDDLLSADPGAIWLLPVGATIWESGQVDLSGISTMVKDSVQRLFSVSRTPFSMGSSDAVNQSAEGAQLSREGLVFKTGDRETISTPRLKRVAAFLFKLAGEDERADASQIILDWAPVERYSLAEKAQADSQAGSLPDEQKWRLIWQLTPDEIAIASAQKAQQQLRQAALAATPGAVPSGQPAT